MIMRRFYMYMYIYTCTIIMPSLIDHTYLISARMRNLPWMKWLSSQRVASFPGSPPLRAIIAWPLNSHSHGKTGGEPGTFYHVSDVKGREKVLGRENLIARG